MARQPRLSAAGFAHHVVQRGNNRQEIFRDAADCERFLAIVAELAPAQGVAVHAYVLMPNHVHMLVTPSENGALSRLMQGLGRRYVHWFNKRHARTGTLWEGRFRASVIQSERYLLACARYIELNPVRAGLTSEATAYRWSSHAHHAGLRLDPVITEHPLVWSLGNTPFERQAAYRQLFERGGEDEVATIRAAIQSGWAVGEASFATEVGAAAGRRAEPRQRGRPRKNVSPIS